MKDRLEGILLGSLGVLAFSITLPATRFVVPQLGAAFIGFGRGAVAGALALLVVLIMREPLPPRQYWSGLAIVVAGRHHRLPVVLRDRAAHAAERA